MDQEELNEIVTAITGAGTAQDVDAIFEQIETFDAADRQQIVSAIEEFLATDFLTPPESVQADIRNDLIQFKTLSLTAADQLIQAHVEQEQLDQLLAMTQLCAHVLNGQGENAHLLVKAFAAATAKVSDDDYGSLKGVYTSLVGAWDATAAPAEKPKNPFRRPTPGM